MRNLSEQIVFFSNEFKKGNKLNLLDINVLLLHYINHYEGEKNTAFLKKMQFFSDEFLTLFGVYIIVSL